MDNGFFWYFIGLAVGIAIGAPGASEIVTKMNAEFRDAARGGAVTAEQNCRALADLQDSLNEKYVRRAGDGVAPSHFAFSMADCLKNTQAPRP